MGQRNVNEDATMPVTLKQLAARAHVHPSTISRVAIPDITNPFFAALFRGVEDGASPRGYNVLLCNTDGSPERQRSHLQSLLARQVDGVILASSFLKDPAVRWLRQQRIPYVLVNRYSDQPHDPFVGSDDVVGGRIATAHLADLGHLRIGHLAGKATVS